MNGIVAWARPQQEALLREITDVAAVTLEAVAAPAADQAAELARRLGVTAVTDLRRRLQTSSPAALLLLADPQPEPLPVQAAAEAGARILTIEPWSGADEGADAALELVPRFRCSPGFLAARDVLPDFGVVQAAGVVALATPAEGTLAARLFDGLDALDACTGEVETIEAALARPLPETPETLARMHGHLTANLRLAERRCASIIASDQAGAWQRRLTLVGERGTLVITDAGFRWTEAGELVDEHDAAGPWTCATLVARHLRRVLDREDSLDAPPARRRLHALCEAARLSCRTGEGESPRRMLEMLGKT